MVRFASIGGEIVRNSAKYPLREGICFDAPQFLTPISHIQLHDPQPR